MLIPQELQLSRDSLPQVLNLLNSMQKVNAKFENDKVIVGL